MVVGTQTTSPLGQMERRPVKSGSIRVERGNCAKPRSKAIGRQPGQIMSLCNLMRPLGKFNPYTLDEIMRQIFHSGAKYSLKPQWSKALQQRHRGLQASITKVKFTYRETQDISRSVHGVQQVSPWYSTISCVAGYMSGVPVW